MMTKDEALRMAIEALEDMSLLRFIILDEFGEPIRRFATKAEAVNFMRNKKGCTLVEISLQSILDNCLF
jgi:hypothetical protein